MKSKDTLLSDQVFQLNVFLWALQELPDNSPTFPVLLKAGYCLHSIGQRVIMPVNTRFTDALQKLTDSTNRSACRPDLWLKHTSDHVMLIIELKARGFSTNSSNRRQAIKLIAASANLAASLGESGERPGQVIYATTSTDAKELGETLKQLALKIETENIPAAPLGLSVYLWKVKV